MKKCEIIFSAVMIALSAGALAVGLSYPYMSNYGPGAGFVPVWASGLMLATNILILAKTLMNRSGGEGARPFFKTPQQGKNFFCFLGALIAFAVAVEFLGILPAGFIYMTAMYRFFDKHSWLRSLGVSAGVAAFFYMMFNVWLNVPLPMGLLDW